MQMPFEMMPQWFTVKALAQRWGVDRDYIAAMIGGRLIETVAVIEGMGSWRNRFGEECEYVKGSPPGMYQIQAGTKIYWQDTSFSPKFQINKHSPDFPLPTRKKELHNLCFNFSAESYSEHGTDYWEPKSVNVYGPVSEFLISKSEVRRIEDVATQDEIRSGEAPRAIVSRRILLTVVNALCVKAGINPKGRSAATEIVRLLDKQGTPAAERTIRDAIKDIPEAMKARKTEQ
jgi:hypothetical protein